MSARPGPRLGIDGFNLAMRHGTGVATYSRTLAEACARNGRGIDLIYGLNVPPHAGPEQRETLFFAALAAGESGGEAPLRRTPWMQARRLLLSPRARDLVEVPVTGRVIRRGVAERVPAFDRLFTLHRLFYVGARYFRRFGRLMPLRVPDPPAVMHWTYPLPVRLLGSRNVYTIHDLVPLRLPYLSLEDKAYHERLLRRCIAEAAHIVTVSDYSRDDILRYLPIAPEKVTNSYQALPACRTVEPTPETLAQRLRALFDLEPQSYLLFFGAIEPKKNLGRLIEAYLAASIDIPLVIAGPDGWRSEDELRLLNGAHGKALRGAERIRRIGYLPAEHLDLLVRGARAMAFPSLYEGFGLPVLEAMTVGTPVIAGTGGALPEIVGDGGLLVDSYDVDAIRRALEAVATDATLRAGLSAAGRRRASVFSFDSYRARIEQLHARLLAEPVSSGRPRHLHASSLDLIGESL